MPETKKLKNAATKSWRTTAWGVLVLVALVSAALVAQFDGDPATAANWKAVLEGLAGVGVFGGLLSARDNAVSSEAAGAE